MLYFIFGSIVMQHFPALNIICGPCKSIQHTLVHQDGFRNILKHEFALVGVAVENEWQQLRHKLPTTLKQLQWRPSTGGIWMIIHFEHPRERCMKACGPACKSWGFECWIDFSQHAFRSNQSFWVAVFVLMFTPVQWPSASCMFHQQVSSCL